MNREEFSARIEINRPKLMKIAGGLVRGSDCEDAVQSAILSAWEHLPQLRDEKAFHAWIAQIVINRCRQIQRGYQREKEKYAAWMAFEHEPHEYDAALDEALKALSEEERRLILQHYHQGYSIKELAAALDKSEDAIKMRLYRARKHLRIILISMLLLILLACAAVGTGVIDVNWFLQNRRAEPAEIQSTFVSQKMEIGYSGDMLNVEISDVVWNPDNLSVMLVYAIAPKGDDALVIHCGNVGVDGIRFDHVWVPEGILPVQEWAAGKPVQVFSLNGWRLNGSHLTAKEDALPEGRGEAFMTELYLAGMCSEQYEDLLDEGNMLVFEADLTLKDYESGAILEAETIAVRIDAPAVQAWREMYEAFYR